MKRRQVDIAWAAGLFDGEGCICIEPLRPGRKAGERSVKFRFRIRVNMTTLGPITKLRRVFGYGSICSYERKDGWNPMHTWACEGEKAAMAVTLMLPYFALKQKEARLGLKFMEFQRRSVPVSLGCRGASYRTLQRRQRFYEKMLDRQNLQEKSVQADPASEFRASSPHQVERCESKESCCIERG